MPTQNNTKGQTQKNVTDPSSQESRSSSITPCQRVQSQINFKDDQLTNWQSRLDFLLSDVDSDISEIGTLRGVVEDLNRDLVRLKAQQRDLGCVTEERSLITNDTQTIISTSSVRRKDRFALALSQNNSLG